MHSRGAPTPDSDSELVQDSIEYLPAEAIRLMSMPTDHPEERPVSPLSEHEPATRPSEESLRAPDPAQREAARFMFPSIDHPQQTNVSQDGPVDQRSDDAPRDPEAKSPASPGRHLGPVTWLTDLFAIAVGLCHLIFVCVVPSCNGHKIEDRCDNYQRALTALGPIFPMLFAFVMGRLLYQAARLRLEKGASLGMLEQLMGSQTVGATLATHWKLRFVNLTGLGLVAAWAFSPLGGQSLLRILHTRPEPTTTRLVYLDLFNSPIANYLDVGDNPALDLFPSSAYDVAMYTVAESGQLQTSDVWGNVKIPFLMSDSKDWHQVNDSSTQEYSAFFGIPVNGMVGGSSNTFTLETNYIRLDCDPLTKKGGLDQKIVQLNGTNLSLDTMVNPILSNNGSHIHDPKPLVNGTYYGGQVASTLIQGQGFGWDLGIDRFVDNYWFDAYSMRYTLAPDKHNLYTFPTLAVYENETDIEAGPTNLSFRYFGAITEPELKGDTAMGLYHLDTKCRVLQEYVESRISCSLSTAHAAKPDCSVTAQRPSQKKRPPQNLSLLSHPFVFDLVAKILPEVTGTPNSASIRDPTISYIFGQPFSMSTVLKIDASQYTSEKSAAALSTRLSQILNSYLLNLQIGSYLDASSIPTKGKLPQYNAKKDANAVVPAFLHADATSMGISHVYKTSRGWLAAAIVSCLVLLTAGVLGAVLAHMGRGPEVLGFVSTAIRDSRYVEIPAHGDGIDGDELARMMKQTRLAYGYAQGGGGNDGGSVMGIGPEEDVVKMGAQSSIPLRTRFRSSASTFLSRREVFNEE